MSEDKLQHIRHSLAHLLARSVLEYYPDAKLTLGPAVDTGFYYDIDFASSAKASGGGEESSFSDNDLKKIQKTMRKLLGSWNTFARVEVSVSEARKFFADNPYKLELIDGIEAAGESVSLYYSGPEDSIPTKDELLEAGSVVVGKGFVDLCRGGHVDNPAADIDAKSFELDSVAGAYWRGDEKNKMLTRIYGLAFSSSEELQEFKAQREEAKKRDHRKLGKELGLFTFSDLVGSGLPLFTPKGTAMRDAITKKISDIQSQFDYQRVTIPHITKPALYEKSGHWEKFREELFHVKGMESEFVMKPMNCPHHTQIYAAEMRSYRDLPLRFVENTMVYRDEQSGELSGLARVRSITQDDGHIFCTPEQMYGEIDQIITVIKEFYSALDMWQEDRFWVSLSVRDPETPGEYLGDNERWNEAEAALKKVAEEQNLSMKVVAGEAAFYGPKIDFMFYDALDRERQLATIQLDFVMPERFELKYTDENGDRQTPVMIHRAIAGSLERFMSVIIEHFAGDFPFWLAPVQLVFLPVSSDHEEYARDLARELKSAGYRVDVIAADDSLGKRIRNLHTQKVPAFAVIGDNEVNSNTVEIEKRSGDEKIKVARDEVADQLADWS
ncbi:MAG: threonine--tRNA ligase [Candidatus Paceibacterota bacterium]